jgi:hypothetical protein
VIVVVARDELLCASWTGSYTRSRAMYVSLFFWCWLWNFALYVVASCHRTLGFTSRSEPMYHLFRSNASHINLWGAWIPNCPTYFGLPENDDDCVLSGFYLIYLPFMISTSQLCCSLAHRYQACDQRIVGLCCQNHEWKVHETEPDNMQWSSFLGEFRTYLSE